MHRWHFKHLLEKFSNFIFETFFSLTEWGPKKCDKDCDCERGEVCYDGECKKECFHDEDCGSNDLTCLRRPEGWGTCEEKSKIISHVIAVSNPY